MTTRCDCGADSWDVTSGAWRCWGCLRDEREQAEGARETVLVCPRTQRHIQYVGGPHPRVRLFPSPDGEVDWTETDRVRGAVTEVQLQNAQEQRRVALFLQYLRETTSAGRLSMLQGDALREWRNKAFSIR